MHRIYCDDKLIYRAGDPRSTLISASVKLKLNESGSLEMEFAEPVEFDTMKSIFTVYDDDVLLFRGRAYAPSDDMYRINGIDCEGELAFFNDSYQEPFDFFGTVSELFNTVVSFHNTQVEESKRFTVGRITVQPKNETGKIVRSSENYLSTAEFMKSKFYGSDLGGYIWFRHENGVTYIDYLADLADISEQPVIQNINLLSASREITSEALATAIVPIGAEIEHDEDYVGLPEYVTIESVNDGKMYIQDDDAIAKYGRIVKLTRHDDITEPLNLLKAGAKDLEESVNPTITTTLTAADLSRAGYEISPFSFGSYVDVSIENMGIDDRFLISEMTLDLLEPEKNTIRIGAKGSSLVDNNNQALDDAATTVLRLNRTIVRYNELTGIINDMGEDMAAFAASVEASIEDLQAQLDGKIDTWYYGYVPTLSNYPANEWTTEALKQEHQGDLFYNTATGKSYRFLKDGNTWKWLEIVDSDVALALQKAQEAKDTADGKRRVFIVQPTPPYDVGDVWMEGVNGDILVCTNAKTTGQVFARADWEKRNKYVDQTDIAALQTYLENEIADVESQIDGKIETYYQTTDPSLNWTQEQKTEHTGDVWNNPSTGKTYRWNSLQWQEMKSTPPAEIMDTIDGKAQVFISQPTVPYHVGDLWFDSATSDIMTCTTERLTGSYNSSDWEKRNKYSDDLDFQTPHTWNSGETIASFEAKVYSDGVDITDQYPEPFFKWFLRNEDNVGEILIATGKTCTVSATQIGYGSTIIGEFTTYDKAYLTTKNGTRITTKNGTLLFVYEEN